MEYATTDEKEKLKYYNDEIIKIKKSPEYKNLMISTKTPANRKKLERFKLKLIQHNSKIEMINSDIKNRKPRRVRNTKPLYGNYPENPAKKRDLLVKEKTTDNRNPHTISRNDKLEPIVVSDKIDEIELSFIL